MKVILNDSDAELPSGATVEDLVRTQDAGSRGVAVAVNGEVVSKTAWDATELRDGDRVEVLQAIGGGA